MEIEDLISITEAARLLNVSRGSIYAAIEDKRLPVVQIAGKQLLSRRAVLAYVPRSYQGKRQMKRPPDHRQ